MSGASNGPLGKVKIIDFKLGVGHFPNRDAFAPFDNFSKKIDQIVMKKFHLVVRI